MSLLNAAICTTISYTLWVEWYYLKKKIFELEVKGQGDTRPYGHAPTHQISLTYLERQKRYGPDKLRWEETEEEAEKEEAEEKIRLKKYVSLR